MNFPRGTCGEAKERNLWGTCWNWRHVALGLNRHIHPGVSVGLLECTRGQSPSAPGPLGTSISLADSKGDGKEGSQE